MSADFNALLDKPMGSIEAPKPLPVGSYIWGIQSYKFDKSAKKQTPYVEFTVAPMQPLEDVPAEDLAASLGETPLSDKTQRLTYYLTPDSLFRLQDFLKDCGQPEGIPLREAVQASQGGQFVGYVTHAPNEKNPGGQPYVNITQTRAVPQ